jgi:hypothetical protein
MARVGFSMMKYKKSKGKKKEAVKVSLRDRESQVEEGNAAISTFRRISDLAK